MFIASAGGRRERRLCSGGLILRVLCVLIPPILVVSNTVDMMQPHTRKEYLSPGRARDSSWYGPVCEVDDFTLEGFEFLTFIQLCNRTIYVSSTGSSCIVLVRVYVFIQ